MEKLEDAVETASTELGYYVIKVIEKQLEVRLLGAGFGLLSYIRKRDREASVSRRLRKYYSRAKSDP